MRKRKGFTLVELLAVVVILGIIMMISIPAVTRWIDRSKSESKESMKQTLVMATQSYAQANKEVLPKVIGQTVTISAENLKKNKYLKQELIDANQKSCMASYVKIHKSDKDKYTYTAYVACEGETIVDNNTNVLPTISISFYGNESNDELQNVSVSSFKAVITGGTDGSTVYKLEGYSYSISVKYTDDVNEKAIEIFSSGNLNAGGKESIIIEKDLGDYTDITKINEFIITVDAYNHKGGYYKVTGTSIYHDTTPPVCGKITGQADADSWLNTMGSTRTISVLCSDGDGSGCVRDKFTKTFDTEMKNGVITIEDNAGNKTDCPVRVNIDWTFPTLTIRAYKRGSNGNRIGDVIGSVTISHSNRLNTVTLNAYTNLVGGWFNAANYRDGVYYYIEVVDNIAPSYGEWHYNSAGIYNENASNLNTLKKGKTKKFTATDNIDEIAITEEGMRRGRYDLRDEAGNLVKIYIIANLDFTNPTCSAKKSHVDTEDGVTVTIECKDSGSKCSASNTLSYTGQKSSSDYSVIDNAGNGGSCRAAVTSYNCHPYNYQCNPHNCNPHNCDPYSCNCSAQIVCWSSGVGCTTITGGSVTVCHGQNPIYSCNVCSTCYHTCYDTCYDTCVGYKTCYK